MRNKPDFVKKLIFLCILVFFTSNTYSQTKTVTGKVISTDGEPAVFASVVVKGTSNGVATDVNGFYSIKGVKDDDILIFSFLGFITQEIQVGSQKTINVTLNPDSEVLDEVVVTALGVKRQTRKIGYSTQKVEPKELQKVNAPNILSAMSGRAAGISISNGDGIDGGSTRITIRGNNNISGRNQPLIVVDGIQMENTPGLTDIGRGQDWGSAINNINPQDIEDINILKGGAASALYGSRGANGVIEITTKKGTEQDGIGISYNMSYSVKYPYRFRDVQNKYGHGGPISLTPPTFPTNAAGDTLLYPGIYDNSNLIINEAGDVSSTSAEFGYYGSSVSWGPEMNGEMVQWWDGVMRPYSPQPDNLRMYFNNGKTIMHNVAASGGGKKGTIRFSYTSTKNTPIISNSNYTQNTVNIGSNLNVSNKVRLSVTSSYIDYNRLNTPMIGEDPNSFSKGSLYCWPRSYQGLEMTNYQYDDGSQNPQEGYPFFYINPQVWWNYNNNNTTLDRNKFLGSVALIYDIAPWLDLSARAGRDFTLSQFETKHKPIDLVGIKDGYYESKLVKDKSDNYDFLFTAYKDSLISPNINAKLSAGAARWDKYYYNMAANSGTWYYPNMYTFFNYSPYVYENDQIIEYGDNLVDIEPTDSIYRRRTNSVYSFLELEYKNYLFLHLTGRNDWSSTLPADNNSYFYPSASLSFIASEAIPMLQTRWLNFWKIRGGAAQTATDGEVYQTEFYYSVGLFGGEQISGFPNTIPPYALRPQRVNSYEIGTTVGMFENRINLDFTYYHMYSFDQIITSPLPNSSGASYIKINDGVLTNNGVEIILNTVPLRKKNFMITSSLNYSKNKNKVVSLGEHADVLDLADIWGLNGPAMALREGDEFGTIYGYDYVYHENGQPILNDAGTHYEITESRVPIGNASPKFLLGWHTSFKYKNLSLGALIDSKIGGEIYCGSYVIALQTGQSPETLLERDGGGLPYTDPDGNTSNIGVILDGVYADGTPNDKVVHYYYKYLPNAGGWGHFLSTPGIVENTWIKMREISLSYDMPQSLISKFKLFKELTVSLIGRNMFYIYTTLPDKINPEGIMGSGDAQGFEWASFPSSRSIIISLNARF